MHTPTVRPTDRLLTFVVLVLSVAATGPATAGSVRGDSAAATAGELLGRRGESWVPLPTVDVAVEVDVTGPMIRGRMTQRFVNPADETIEAIYVYPLPDGAAVHAMEILVGQRRIVAEVREREQARRTYESARDDGRKAALVDRRSSNLFRTSVAGIDPGEQVVVRLEWVEEARWSDGRFSLALPLTFTPRFAPRGTADGPSAPIEPPVEVEIRLRPGLPLAAVESRSHEIDVDRRPDGTILVRPAGGRSIPGDRDLLLDWTPERGSRPRSAAFVERGEDGDYALVMLVPPGENGETAPGLPTETLFVVDVSGSMAGPSIVQARQALLAALDRLRPDDRFDLLAFNDGSTSFAGAFRNADRDTVVAARSWVAGLRAGGGTMIAPALLRALDELGGARSRRGQRLVFLTDGAVANEGEVLEAIVSRLGDARLHAIGIGQAPNAWLMRRMATLGHGLCEFITTVDEADNRVAAFLERIDRPVMTDLRVWWEGVDAVDVAPERMPDLHAGEPLVLSARLSGGRAGGRVLVAGWTREGEVDLAAELDPAAPAASGVALRWARSRVVELLDGVHVGADPEDVRRQVVDLGLEFGLVTPYTSLVAVEERPSALGPVAASRLVAPLPSGGSGRPLRRWIGLLLAAGGALLYGLCAWTRP